MRLKVKCPAKINTRLKVFPIDRTGYHPIETSFQAVGLFDTLDITFEASYQDIRSNWEFLTENSTLHKVLMFAKEYRTLPNLLIYLDKKIPIQAGLGGGSSDAAGLIRALARTYPEVFSFDIQLEIARAVGKDVAFFLYGGYAHATGYGDTIQPAEERPIDWLCITQPDVLISTAQAYSDLDQIIERGLDAFQNDFESVMPDECTKVKELLFEQQALNAQLCGSGSAVYGRFINKQQAEQAAIMMVAKGYSNTFVVPTLTREESLWISSY